MTRSRLGRGPAQSRPHKLCQPRPAPRHYPQPCIKSARYNFTSPVHTTLPFSPPPAMSKPPTLVDALTADLASATLAAGPLRARLSSGAPKLQHWLDSEVSANNGEVVLHVGGDEVYTVSDELNADLMSLVDAASHVGCRTAVLRCGPLPGHAELNGGDSSRSPPSLATPARADGRLSAHILIRRTPQSVKDFLETRIAVVGNVDAGKSTLLGVLTKGSLDDGRGRARVNLFRHKHEIESGRTSSVGMEIMGFDAAGQPVNSAHLGRLAAGSSHSSADPLAPLVDEDFSDSPPSANVRKLSWEDVCENSAKVISFIVRGYCLISCSIDSEP